MGSERPHFEGGYGVDQVINGTGGGSEMENKIQTAVYLDMLGHIVFDETEFFVFDMGDNSQFLIEE